MPAAITVVTVTRARPALLRRAINSVAQQQLPTLPEHLIIVDGCSETAAMLRAARFPLVRWQFVDRPDAEPVGVVRLARLRNLALPLIETPWVAMLDDDNEFEPDHLTTLLDCAAATGCRAVYSWRRLFTPRGEPYLEPRFPWASNGETARRTYGEWVRRGVFESGSNVMRDAADPLDHPNPIRTIDANEWLLSTDLMRSIRFSERYDFSGPGPRVYDDGRLLLDLLERGEPLACTELPTVRYRLGGYSNSLAPENRLVAAQVSA